MNLKKTRILSVIVCLCMMLSIAPSISMTVMAAEHEAEMLTLTPGQTTSEINLTWYGDETDGKSGKVKFAPKAAMVSNEFPTDTVVVNAIGIEASTGKISHKATLTGLEPNTEYVYAVSNEGTNYSRQYTYKTPAKGAFTFVMVGDPQLTDVAVSPDDSEADPPTPGGFMEENHSKTTTQGWQDTINAILNVTPSVAFIAGVGDQVDRNLIDGSPESRLDEHEPKYANFFAPSVLRNIPFAPAIGNHEARSNLSFLYHYNLPNESTITESDRVITSESARSGRETMQLVQSLGNYYYLYNNALFVVLNSSARVDDIEQASVMVNIFDDVLRNATTIHKGQYQWLFVQHHKTTIGIADHAADKDIQYYVEAGFEKLMDKYSVDFVFAGHDHNYARSYPMYDGKRVDGKVGNNITDVGGTIYFTLNSSSGQKFYEEFVPAIIDNTDYPYFGDGITGSEELMSGKVPYAVYKYHQNYKPMFMSADVSDRAVTFTVYEMQEDLTTKVVDTLTVSKAKDITVNILHTNDVHGRVYQVDNNNSGMMGIDKVTAIKNNTDNAILVDVGDAIHGLPIVNTNNGLNAIELMAAAGYSIMTPGNHDFNYGSTRLSELANIAFGKGLDMISSNVYNKSGTNFLPTTKIIETDGVKVGFFGLTTQETPILTGPVNVETLEFRAYKASAETAIAELKNNGAQIIVALAHVTRTEIETLIKTLDVKPDVVIEGHDHTLGSVTIDGVLIAGAGQYQENLGKVSITLNSNNEIINKTATYITKGETDDMTGNPTVRALAEEKRVTVEAEFNVVVAQSGITLSSARGTDNGETLGVRNSEQALGNLVADAMKTIGKTDIAITNGGGLRADIRTGNITKGDINAVLPFGNVLIIKEVTPKILKDIIEVGLSTLPVVHGRFPHISGMNIVYNPENPEGERVVSITINGNTLDLMNDTDKYKLATNDFMANGGDGYDVFTTLATIAELDSLDDMLAKYITENLSGKITENDAKIEGRFIIGSMSDTALSAVYSPVSKSNPKNQREGQVIGYILNSDIVAYINGNAIPSWSVDNKTVVVAEDLVNYGFDIIWNDEDNSLHISYNPSKTINPVATEKNTKKSGSNYCRYIATNIKTYIAGNEVQAYNISGKTLINIEELGNVIWDEVKREIKVAVK